MTDEPKPNRDQPEDKTLGMEQPISRRDFLNATLLASGGALMGSASPLQLLSEDDWTGYGGVGDYSRSNGNTYEIMQAGHRIRDGEFEKIPATASDTGEIYDCVVVGGGISGLAAALFFLRQAGAGRTCLVLDNHPIFGGEAKGNEFLVDGHRLLAHQGSAVYFVQYPHSFLARFYDSIGLKTPKLQYQSWAGAAPEIPLSKTPYDMVGSEPATYGFYFGAKFGGGLGVWLIDPWGQELRGAPISDAARADLLRWRRGPALSEKRPQYHGDEISRQLDQITLEEHMMRLYGISRETIRAFLSPVEGGGSGLGPDALSAYADYAADMLHPLETEDGDQMLPRGNGDIARLMMKALVPDAISGADSVAEVCNGRVNFAALDRPGAAARVRLSATAVWVEHEGDPAKAEFVSIIYSQGKAIATGEGAHGGDGGRLLDNQTYRARFASGATRCLRPVLSLAVHDGQRRAAQLAIPLQDGDQRMPVV